MITYLPTLFYFKNIHLSKKLHSEHSVTASHKIYMLIIILY